jgi:hypothetical protein
VRWRVEADRNDCERWVDGWVQMVHGCEAEREMQRGGGDGMGEQVRGGVGASSKGMLACSKNAWLAAGSYMKMQKRREN